jgi:hypothetical protein
MPTPKIFEAALACQGVVDGQQNRSLAQQRKQKAKDRQPQLIQRPSVRREETVISRVMLGSNSIGRQNHARDGAPAGKDPAQQQGQKTVERRGSHHRRKRLQRIEERGYKRHESLLAQCFGLATAHCQRGFSSLATYVPLA